VILYTVPRRYDSALRACNEAKTRGVAAGHVRHCGAPSRSRRRREVMAIDAQRMPPSAPEISRTGCARERRATNHVLSAAGLLRGPPGTVRHVHLGGSRPRRHRGRRRPRTTGSHASAGVDWRRRNSQHGGVRESLPTPRRPQPGCLNQGPSRRPSRSPWGDDPQPGSPPPLRGATPGDEGAGVETSSAPWDVDRPRTTTGGNRAAPGGRSPRGRLAGRTGRPRWSTAHGAAASISSGQVRQVQLYRLTYSRGRRAGLVGQPASDLRFHCRADRIRTCDP
jgi:hypothetical protein